MAGVTDKGSLEAFEPRLQGGKRALVRREWPDTVAGALFDGTGCVPSEKTGRGGLVRFPYAQGWGVVRRYLRGGVLGHFVQDAYFLVNRPRRELHIHARLFEAGLSVPEPLGVCWERSGPWVRGALATHEVEAENLFESLTRDPGGADDVLRRCGALIRRMHNLGVFHADLQVRNILVAVDRVYLIDFDKARLARRLTRLERARNLFRLRRSIEKNGLPLAAFEPICEGYGAEALPAWMGRIYRAKGKLSDALTGRGAAHDRPAD